MMIKHLPDFPFLMSEKLYARMLNVFADTLSLWDAVENAHLIVIGTFTIIPSGLALFEEIGLMLTTENWIPFEHASEKRLLEKLAKEGRSFAKGLRYNLPSYRPCASVVLLDTEPEPTAMYIVPNESEEYAEALQQLIEASELPAWVWDPAEQAIPTFPEKG
jgi:hypothetical protein